jgi:predicted nucleic acid-binding protein
MAALPGAGDHDGDHARALDSKERWGISYWDAAILEAARAAGCREVLSEDLSHGQNYGGILVTNPFL